MLNETYRGMLAHKSVIRETFMYGKQRAAQIGYENVFDYSLGNPSVPCPEQFTAAMQELLAQEDPVALHGYCPSQGDPEFRTAVAAHLNRTFGLPYAQKDIFPTTGAAGAIAHAVRAVTRPGDEVLTFAPYFPEYGPYVEGTGAHLRVVPPQAPAFQPNLEAFEQMLTEKVTCVLINTPNNPTGVIYSEETLQKIAAILEKKQKEFGTSIVLLSDEPYRELAYDGAVVPYVTKYYRNTVVCYSYSKSLSLPGERIGYLVIPSEMDESANVFQAATIANRVLGCVNAPSLMQRVIKRCVDANVNLEAYDRNRNLLYNGLKECGFSCIKPEGAFYLFVKSPVENEKEFCEVCKQYNVLVVPGSSFACPGYVRIAYCVSYGQIERSLPAFRKIAEHYNLV